MVNSEDERIPQPWGHGRGGFSIRDELARDKGEGDEEGDQHHAGEGEDDLDTVRFEEGSEEPAAAEEEDEDEPGDDGGDGEGDVDDGFEQGLATEVELGDGPGGGDA